MKRSIIEKLDNILCTSIPGLTFVGLGMHFYVSPNSKLKKPMPGTIGINNSKTTLPQISNRAHPVGRAGVLLFSALLAAFPLQENLL